MGKNLRDKIIFSLRPAVAPAVFWMWQGHLEPFLLGPTSLVGLVAHVTCLSKVLNLSKNPKE
jgi:hypothetical protein